MSQVISEGNEAKRKMMLIEPDSISLWRSFLPAAHRPTNCSCGAIIVEVDTTVFMYVSVDTQ